MSRLSTERAECKATTDHCARDPVLIEHSQAAINRCSILRSEGVRVSCRVTGSKFEGLNPHRPRIAVTVRACDVAISPPSLTRSAAVTRAKRRPRACSAGRWQRPLSAVRSAALTVAAATAATAAAFDPVPLGLALRSAVVFTPELPPANHHHAVIQPWASERSVSSRAGY
jgi:hypothetical protein